MGASCPASCNFETYFTDILSTQVANPAYRKIPAGPPRDYIQEFTVYPKLAEYVSLNPKFDAK